MNELALFAGAGGGILGGLLLGWRTVCAVEFDEHARNVLVARQNDGSLEPFPIWDDVSTFDGKPWRGIVDVVSGGFPCQDISCAGNGKGIDGERSGLWSEMLRIIGEVQPRFCFVENSPMLLVRGVGRVLGDLASLGYDAKWGVIGGEALGGHHQRERIWIVANNREKRGSWEHVLETYRCNSNRRGLCAKVLPMRWNAGEGPVYWQSEPGVGRVADGLATRVDKRLERIGNGQIPCVAAKAWHVLCQEIGPKKE